MIQRMHYLNFRYKILYNTWLSIRFQNFHSNW